uniref:Uncharacterized protein n=1 Tax=Lepeophtheirus salmonis TaxID=72036 RepID=A0A0K2UL40_LEPSM
MDTFRMVMFRWVMILLMSVMEPILSPCPILKHRRC